MQTLHNKNKLKIFFENDVFKACILTVFEKICREKNENKNALACIMTLFETVFETAMRKKNSKCFDLIKVEVT